MDIFLLHRLITEMAPLLTGHRAGRAWQIGMTDLVVDFNLRDGRRLYISTDPLRLGVYLTDQEVRELQPSPRTDTSFVSLWRKHLDGLRLTSIDPLGYDRVVHFKFGDEPEEERCLVVSLTGRSANLYLRAGDIILAELREREVALEIYRDPSPPLDQLDPLTSSAEDVARLLTAADGKIDISASRHLLGFTPLYGREIEARLGQGLNFAEAWQEMISDLTSGTGEPTVYANPPIEQLQERPGIDEMELILSPISLRHLRSELQTHPATLNKAADLYFKLLNERRQFVGTRQRLGTHLNSRLKKLTSLLNNLDREAARYGGVEQWQRYGDLLLTNSHEAIMTEGGNWLVVDYFDPDEQLIEIDAAGCGTIQESAEHYFRLARKGRHSRESIAARRPPVTAEMAALETDRARLDSITRIDELLPLVKKYGLGDGPRIGVAADNRGRRPSPAPAPVQGARRYRSGDGYEILVGRTDRDNDHLTQRIARSADLWFHAADYPGSHVILRNPKRQPVPHRSILEAAQLAAKFSQARELPKVAVNYCERKFVTKPRGFAPGQVRLASFRTILVEPIEAGERI